MNRPYCGTCADIWSCGVILFTLVSGYLPFEQEIYQKLFKKIREVDY
jgi:serine/threonine protein kinase